MTRQLRLSVLVKGRLSVCLALLGLGVSPIYIASTDFSCLTGKTISIVARHTKFPLRDFLCLRVVLRLLSSIVLLRWAVMKESVDKSMVYLSIDKTLVSKGQQEDGVYHRTIFGTYRGL